MKLENSLKKWSRKILPHRVQNGLIKIRQKRWISLQRRNLAALYGTENVCQSPFSFAIAKENPLEELGRKYEPSKRLHNYLTYYWMHFRDIRFSVKTVLEIGIQSERSIQLWEEFFPNATIYGIDIDADCRRFAGERRKVFIGDQSDADFLTQVVNQIDGALDIVIDDGSHLPAHQMASFTFLFPRMSNHGIYVIEDTGGCVGDVDLLTVNSLKSVIDSIMYWPKGMDARNWPFVHEFPDEANWLDHNVIGIAFYRWIVFIMRGKNPQDNPFLARHPQKTS